ncbi:MAG: hypothetical protein ACOXZ5_00850 [Syntrophomonadaceae bacterium]
MKVFLNGKEIKFVDGGYEYVFTKPYSKHTSEVIEKGFGQLTIQLYDNGVQIRTLVTRDEINTLINRDVRVDFDNRKIFILDNDRDANG